ncbi:MAG: hypothetical protein ACXQTJ_05405 [Candidatus Syntropharchaeales archaeon]
MRRDETLIASVAFALFILCPRMAGMTKIISDAGDVNLIKVITDFAAAFAIREISMKAGVKRYDHEPRRDGVAGDLKRPLKRLRRKNAVWIRSLR